MIFTEQIKFVVKKKINLIGSFTLMKRISRVITPAEILNMFTVPIIIIPNPGVGKTIMPVVFSVKFTPGASLYLNGGNIIFTYSSLISSLTSSINSAFIKVANSSTFLRPLGLTDLFNVDFSNNSLCLTNLSANFTAGNGSLLVEILYYIY